MAHLTDGTLRRLYDEPVAVAASARDHFQGCARCQDRFAQVAETARETQAALAVPAATVDARAAYAAVLARAQNPRAGWLRVLRGRRRPLLAGGLAAALVAGVTVSAVALNATKIFEPTQTQAVPINVASLNGFPDLSNWGDVKVLGQPELKEQPSAAAAARDSGLGLTLPATLPAGITVPAPQYATLGQASAAFTFSADKAAKAASHEGHPAPPLPSNLNGSTLTVTGGPTQVAVYGSIDPAALRSGQVPPLVIAEARAPVVTSTGASVADIENAVIKQPGVSPDLAAAIRSIGNPASTLVIPVPLDKAQAHDIRLADGTRATYVGDNTGIYAAVIFVRNHVVYAVAGSLTQDQLIAVAGSLK